MRMSGRVAFVAAVSVLAISAPVSAQFGGLGALKKKLESAVKELEKPKSPPAPTTPQSTSKSSQGGHAAPTQMSQPRPLSAAPTPAIAQPVNASAIAAEQSPPVTPQIVSAEVWDCFNEESSKPIRFELDYVSTQKNNERGSFREISPFNEEGNETRTPNVSSGSFRYEQTPNWNFLKLEYADQAREYRSFTSSVGEDGVRYGEMDNLQCDLVSAKTTQDTQQRAAASLENSDNATKMQVAMAELQKRGAVTYFVPADESASGLPETTKPLAFFDTDFGPILLTGTQTDGETLRAPSEFRVHRLRYDRDNRFSYVKTDGEFFHYGSEGRIPEYKIGYDYSNDLTLSFQNRGGGSGCFGSNLVLVSIRRDGSISSDLMLSSSYSGPNNRTIEFSGQIIGSVKGESLTIEVTHKDYIERAGKTVFSKNAKFLQKYLYSNGRWSLETGAAQIEMC